MRDHQIELSYGAEELPVYIRRILTSGNCDALRRAVGFTDPEGVCRLRFDCSGTAVMKDILAEDGGILLERYKMLLKMMEKICAAVIRAGDYLIPPEYLCLDAERIFFQKEPPAAFLLPAAPDAIRTNKAEGLGARLVRLLEEVHEAFPQLGADVAAARLEQEAAASIPDAAQLRRLFSLWLAELN